MFVMEVCSEGSDNVRVVVNCLGTIESLFILIFGELDYDLCLGGNIRHSIF